ncbi:hypothetical protein FRC10_001273 [Ceratobasidium sp. 414]|nr:hypothetical protein FRC10_001273 [Ceratobasidium sp. 414]
MDCDGDLSFGLNVGGLGSFKTTGSGSTTAFPEISHKRVIGIDITFNCPGKPPIRRSFLRSEYRAVHLGREPADACGVANAFARGDIVPPVMSRKHAEIMWVHDAPQVMDIGSYHGTYFQGVGQRLMPNKPYPLWDGSVLEFGKSVTKDDKAHEPLMATIKFIHEVDRLGLGLMTRVPREPSGLFSPSSPPRRYGIPSDSDEDEDDDEDDDEDLDESDNSSASGSRSDVFEYTPEGLTRPHIDLTGMSDDDNAHKFAHETDGIECLGFGYATNNKNLYDDGPAGSSDMSESEYEEEVVAPAPQRIIQGGVSSLEAAVVHVPAPIVANEPRGPSEGETSAPRAVEVDIGPSEEVRSLRVELDKAIHEITGLKGLLEWKEKKEQERAQEEAEKDKDGDVQIAEQPAQDMPSRIANIENMVQQLATVGDVEICEHRSAIQEMLGQLASGIEALRVRVGGEPSVPALSNNKRKRADDDEEEEVEPRRAQSPMPMTATASVSTQASDPMPAPSPSKRSRLGASTLGVVVGGAAVWSALAFDLI